MDSTDPDYWYKQMVSHSLAEDKGLGIHRVCNDLAQLAAEHKVRDTDVIALWLQIGWE